MPPTLATLADLPQLGLRVLTCPEALGREVRWVATSELGDPTPWLDGGELLLTTGMRLDEESAPGYVRRLVDGGRVVGLGFAVGLSHEVTPPALAGAAAQAGLPLLEVPVPTPFIAIGKALHALLTADEHEALRRASEAQRALTRAALRGAPAVVSRLARELGGWALLLDVGGGVRDAAPASAAGRAVALRAELSRLRGPRAASAASLAGDDGWTVLHVLGAGDTREGARGFLAAGGPGVPGRYAHSLLGVAVSLLGVELEKSRSHVELRQRVRGGLVRLLLGGYVDAARLLAGEVGVGLPAGPVRVAAADRSDLPVVALAAEPVLAGHLGAEVDGRTVLLVPADPDAFDAERAALARVAGGAVGIGGLVSVAELGRGRAQAEQALAAARRSAVARGTGAGAGFGEALRGGAVVIEHGELSGGLLGLIEPAAARGFAESSLRPLLGDESRVDLVGSLRAYLAAAGRWDAAAESLGVHRHTLRHRVRRIRELLGRDLDDPTVRAELWLALQSLDRP